MKKIVFALILGVCGCTTTEQANNALASRFVGTSADSFFIAYGPPSSSYKLTSGDGVLYTWAEPAKTYVMPGQSNTTFIGNRAFTTYSPGNSYDVQCTLKIAVDGKGIIRQIDVLRDTMGDWQLSRCNEVFSKKA
ncbi:MAG: hypothetical protein ACK4SQ_04015 [Allorhizobium sp.]